MAGGRVLVTGSEGFTGQYVCRELSQAGWEVYRAGLTAKPDEPRYLCVDLLDPSSLLPIADLEVDVVIHLAAMAFVAEQDPAPFYQVNLLGTRHLLETLAAAKHPPACTIIASSANIYGNTTAGAISEKVPPNPANDYAVSKLAMEYLVRTYMNRLGIVITRPFNYTGVGQNPRFLIPKIVTHFVARQPKIELGNLNVEREFSDVRDIAQLYRLLAEKQPVGETLNLCSGQPVSLHACIELAQEITGHVITVKVNPDFVRTNEIKTLSGNRSKLTTLLQPSPPRQFRETLKWMLSTTQATGNM